MTAARAKLAFGAALLLVGVGSGIWFTERLRVYPGPPLQVALGELDNESGEPRLDGALELLLDEGRFVRGEPARYALAGRVAKEGSGYRIEVRVVEAETNETLARAGARVRDEEELPRVFDELSAELRRELARNGR